MTPEPLAATVALKPCPFCGAAGKLTDRQGYGAPRWKAECSKCSCEAWPDDTEDAAAQRWNTRDDERIRRLLALNDELAGALRDAMNAIHYYGFRIDTDKWRAALAKYEASKPQTGE